MTPADHRPAPSDDAPPNLQDWIDEQAADWVARIGASPLMPAERQALEIWLNADPRHRTTFDEAVCAWETVGLLSIDPDIRALAAPGSAPGAAPGAAPVPVGLAAARFSRQQRRRMPRPLVQGAAMAACLLVLLGAGGLWFGNPYILWQADHATGPAEIATVTLPEGSTVAVGPDSALAVHYGPGERRITLLDGIAVFAVAPTGVDGERRPFVVEAGPGTIEALGTTFQVNALADHIEVTAVEHAIRVSLPATGTAPAEQQILEPGDTVSYSATDRIGAVLPVSTNHALAWRRGRLIFDRVPLSTVVAELNRYRRGEIVIADSALADRLVSGAFDTSDPDNALRTITRTLDAHTATLPPFLTVVY